MVLLRVIHLLDFFYKLYILPQVVEAFEMMIVTILSAAVKCQWDLRPYQEALITTVSHHGNVYLIDLMMPLEQGHTFGTWLD